jgi:hypothetical protein
MALEIFAVWILIEIFNYIYYYFLYNFVAKKKYFYTSSNDAIWMSEYIIDQTSKTELKEVIKHTFSSKIKNTVVHLEDIKLDNMKKWAVYMLYAKSMWQITSSQYNKAKELVKTIEKKIDYTFDNGKNSSIYMLRFGNNNIRTKWKPAIYYASIYIIKWSLYMILKWQGYKCFRSEKSGVLYFYKQNKSATWNLFLHGFGLGVIPYKRIIDKISKGQNIIFPILPNISNLEFHSYFDILNYNVLFPDYKLWRDDFQMLIKKFDIKSLNIIGHSFGTILVSIAMKDINIKSYINKIVMLEPVCFIDGCYKIYRYINDPYDGKNKLLSAVLDYILYQDIYTRYVTQRFMYGPEFWIKDSRYLKKFKHIILLSEKDQIVPSNKLSTTFDKGGINYYIVKDSYHGDLILLSSHKKHIDKIIRFL